MPPGDDLPPHPGPSERPWFHPSELPAAGESAPARRQRLGAHLALALASAALTAGAVVLALGSNGSGSGNHSATVSPTALLPAGADGGEIPTPVLEVVAWDGPKSRYGSALVYGSEGVVVTAAGVVAGASTIAVRAHDAEVTAEVVGLDRDNDLAVLRVPVRVGPSAFDSLDDVAEGEACRVVAMTGHAGGVVVANGMIAGTGLVVPLGRRWLVDAIEFEAPTGSSAAGGALIDDEGKLVGMVTSARSEHGGRPLAVPIGAVRVSVEQILAEGKAEHPWLGVAARNEHGVEGAVVISVAPDSPAAIGGLEPGDVVTVVGGVPTVDADGLVAAVRALDPGDRVAITVLRGSEQHEVEVRLQGR